MTTNLKHKIVLVTGDWSHDGHGMSEELHYLSNVTAKELSKLHGVASKLYGIDLENQCSDYEESELTERFVNTVTSAFAPYPEALELINLEDPYIDSDTFSELYFWIAKLASKDLEWEKVHKNHEDHIQIGGYGLFSS